LLSPVAVFLLGMLVIPQFEQGSVTHLVASALLLFGIASGLVATVLFQRWLLNFVNPNAEMRAKIIGLGWFGNAWIAVRELLDQAVLRGGESPD